MANPDKSSQPPLKEHDPLARFIHRTHGFVERYFKYAFAGIVIVFGVLGAGLLYQYWGERVNQRAVEELYLARQALAMKEKRTGGEILKWAPSANFFKPVKKAPQYTEAMSQQAQQYRKIIKKWFHQPAGRGGGDRAGVFFV